MHLTVLVSHRPIVTEVFVCLTKLVIKLPSIYTKCKQG